MNKTQNTPENKVAFMAQYWGQMVFVNPILSIEPVSNIYLFEFEEPEDVEQEYLKLRPLESITDEDLKGAGFSCIPEGAKIEFKYFGWKACDKTRK